MEKKRKAKKNKPMRRQMLAPIGVLGQNNLMTFLQNPTLIDEDEDGCIYACTKTSRKNKKDGVIPETVEITYRTNSGEKLKSIPINVDKLLKMGQHAIITTAEIQEPGPNYGLFYISLAEQVILKKYKGVAPQEGITREELKEERKVQREAIRYLKKIGANITRRIAYIDPTTKKKKYKTVIYEVDSIIQTEVKDLSEPNIIYLRFNSDLTDYILDIAQGSAKRLINITDTGLTIDAKHPNPYGLHQAIMRHYNNYANRTKLPTKTPTYDTLKVETLLKATNYNFKMSEIKAKKKKWEFYKNRLEKDLDYLIEVGAIDDWGYIRELTPDIKGVSRFEILNAEPQTDTERDKLKEAKDEMKEIDKLEKGQPFYSYTEWRKVSIYFRAENSQDASFEVIKANRIKRLEKAMERNKKRKGR